MILPAVAKRVSMRLSAHGEEPLRCGRRPLHLHLPAETEES